ncbi:hypothetical protein, partial [Leptospira kmetyi]|uniref:hypothetical protein n=1 Tax=Leptospira kmetyi TaxID=408139 RepID=UPI003EC06A13
SLIAVYILLRNDNQIRITPGSQKSQAINVWLFVLEEETELQNPVSQIYGRSFDSISNSSHTNKILSYRRVGRNYIHLLKVKIFEIKTDF